MGGYGGADARSIYGAGYGGQAVSAQASPYGVPAASVPVSQYSGYGMHWIALFQLALPTLFECKW